MTVVRYEPWSLVNKFQSDIDRLFGAPQTTAADSGAWLPAVDMHEEANQFLLHVDLPGVDPKTVEITSEQGVLTIRGQREEARREAREGYRRIERITGEFHAPLQPAGDGGRAEHQGEGRQWRARSRNSESGPSATAANHGGSRLSGSAERDLPCKIAGRCGGDARAGLRLRPSLCVAGVRCLEQQII